MMIASGVGSEADVSHLSPGKACLIFVYLYTSSLIKAHHLNSICLLDVFLTQFSSW